MLGEKGGKECVGWAGEWGWCGGNEFVVKLFVGVSELGRWMDGRWVD